MRRVVLQTPTVAHLVKKFPILYKRRRLIIVLTRARHYQHYRSHVYIRFQILSNPTTFHTNLASSLPHTFRPYMVIVSGLLMPVSTSVHWTSVSVISCSKVINGGQTDRQIGNLISLLSFLESRLKIKMNRLKKWMLNYTYKIDYVTNESAVCCSC
jgi:hypothetical protein